MNRPIVAALFILVIAVFVAFDAHRLGVAQPLPEAASQRVQCLSYAPFRRPGESPFIEGTLVPRERLREDLKALAARSDCIRTYSVQQGLDAVPDVARELGMQVLLGVWLGRNLEENTNEMRKALDLTKKYPDTIRALIVGNEVLLRRELSEAQIAGYLDEARRGSAVPITYADVWEFWSAHPALARHVNFVTVHILPYWEDEPVAIDGAVAHVVEIAARMRRLFEGREILVGETGWPSAGRMRHGALPGRVNQARFFREFSIAAREHGLRYNFIEAFDQPWKRRLEGAMGGAWGLFDSDIAAKFPATGPVEAEPRWRLRFAAGAAGALAGLAAFLALRARGAGSGSAWPGGATATALGFVAGALLEAQRVYLVVWSRDAIEWAAGGSISLAGLLLAACALWLLARPGSSGARRIGRTAARYVLFGLAVFVVLLVFDPRYRGFPAALYGLPLAALGLARLGGTVGPLVASEDRLLGWIVLSGSIGVVLHERLENHEALGFVALAVLFVYVATGLPGPSGWRRASTTAASTAATAAGS